MVCVEQCCDTDVIFFEFEGGCCADLLHTTDSLSLNYPYAHFHNNRHSTHYFFHPKKTRQLYHSPLPLSYHTLALTDKSIESLRDHLPPVL